MDVLIPNPNSAWAAALAIVLIVFVQLLKSARGSGKGRSAPEAAGAWPIIGHLHLLNPFRQLPHITLAAMAERYGPVFTIRLGVRQALVVSTWETAKECFTGTNDVVVSSRPRFIATELMGYNDAMFGFAAYGPFWRELRKISSVELLSNHRLELLKDGRASEVEASVKDLYNIWCDRKDCAQGRVIVDMKQWFANLTLSIIVRMVVGKWHFGALKGEEGEDARRCQVAFREFFELLGQFLVGDGVPFLRWLDLGGHEKAMKKTAAELDVILDKWYEEHLQKKDSLGKGDVEQDFMDVMLSVLQGTDFGVDARSLNKATCMSMISGGSDTTMVALTWALSLLVNNPQVLKKAQEELDVHVGRERQVQESDISKLVYLQAVTKETMRLNPVAPLGGQRQFTHDCTIAGYSIPKGTVLTMNTWLIQRDPRVWGPDATEFRPERFLTTHKDVDVRGQHHEFLPFGGGRRACPGISFGLIVVNLTLASFLHAFDFSTPTDAPTDMSETFGLTNVKTTPLDVVVTPRLPPHAYGAK